MKKVSNACWDSQTSVTWSPWSSNQATWTCPPAAGISSQATASRTVSYCSGVTSAQCIDITTAMCKAPLVLPVSAWGWFHPASSAGQGVRRRTGVCRPLSRAQTVRGTGWISSALWPARSWMRWTASAEGASERQ